MSKIKILHITDIHLQNNEAENQGLVISAFLSDLQKTFSVDDYDNNFCIISGDLVNKGNVSSPINSTVKN